MWNPFRIARERQAADRQLLLDAMQAQHETAMQAISTMNATAGKMAEASKAQAESFTAYLSLFKVQAPPESRVMRNEDEFNEQLRREGFPVDSSEEDQLRWVLAQGE